MGAGSYEFDPEQSTGLPSGIPAGQSSDPKRRRDQQQRWWGESEDALLKQEGEVEGPAILGPKQRVTRYIHGSGNTMRRNTRLLLRDEAH